MNPAFSVIFLTTLLGAGQGLFLALYAVHVVTADVVTAHVAARLDPPISFLVAGALVSAALVAGGLVASVFHLGRPERAWRAASQWRTSWLSREVIALPAFLASALAYAGALAFAPGWAMLVGGVACLLCAALFACTGMVYACIRFLQEWATPLTLVNFALLGLASGTTLAAALAPFAAPALAAPLAVAAVVFTLAGFAGRAASLRRNARLRPMSTLQSAIGVKHPRIAQKAQGFMGGSFNTREFFHGATRGRMLAIRQGFMVATFAIPLALLVVAILGNASGLCVLAFAVQYAGLVAERWYFLADANHPQNLYYQAMS
ncbi:MAG: DmsC/YnfH family molybdoenzyme membrane anchor subunit [Burkholderiales bacterium]